MYVNQVRAYQEMLDQVIPYSGPVAENVVVDCFGVFTPAEFVRVDYAAPREVQTRVPTIITHGEGWFEYIDWVASIRRATGTYCAVSLGAAYGAQVVGPFVAARALNPTLAIRVLGVDPVPANCTAIYKHMLLNDIDPSEHGIIQAAVGADNEPTLFPVGAPCTGRNNAVMTNSPQGRKEWSYKLGREEPLKVLRSLILNNTTGKMCDLGAGYQAEVKFVSTVTLRDVLWPFKRVDLLEVDIQQSEIYVLPAALDVLKRKVRRIHIGTHGGEAHTMLCGLFIREGWDLVFDYAPEQHHVTPAGEFDTQDGILTFINVRV